jgi:hypothetical protein
MSLSCNCDWDGDTEGLDWWWNDHSSLKPIDSVRRKRCCSCKELISHEDECLEFYRFRNARSYIEEEIYDDEGVPLASWYMCEGCSGMYLALEELGYCIQIGDSMRECVAEYNEMRKQK